MKFPTIALFSILIALFCNLSVAQDTNLRGLTHTTPYHGPPSYSNGGYNSGYNYGGSYYYGKGPDFWGIFDYVGDTLDFVGDVTSGALHWALYPLKYIFYH